MTSLTYGIVPDDLELTEPYEMRLNGYGLVLVAKIVNQGIDSHLEAVFTDTFNGGPHHRGIAIRDTQSMKCFLRRCVESDNDGALAFASDILSTLGYEWV